MTNLDYSIRMDTVRVLERLASEAEASEDPLDHILAATYRRQAEHTAMEAHARL